MDWENITRIGLAWAPIVISIAVAIISLGNYLLARRKRKDELFDRRYKFLKDFEELWKSTRPESEGGVIPSLEWDDLEPWAQEAYYLFGNEISKHIRSYEGKSYNGGIPWVPDTELAKPFYKYLKFQNKSDDYGREIGLYDDLYG